MNPADCIPLAAQHFCQHILAAAVAHVPKRFCRREAHFRRVIVESRPQRGDRSARFPLRTSSQAIPVNPTSRKAARQPECRIIQATTGGSQDSDYWTIRY